MTKIFIALSVFLAVNSIWCLCPPLEPNHNVAVLCSVGQGANRKPIKCLKEDKNATNKFEVTVETTAEYKCSKYFKVAIGNQKGGKLNCTVEGHWTNSREFKNFNCETECGRRPSYKNELISGGNSTIGKHWPWVATIFRKTKEGHFKYSCGGMLIGQQAILTAAHCVSDGQMNKLTASTFKIFFAALSSSFESNTKGGIQGLSVKDIHMHPDYISTNVFADIALIFLSEPVALGDDLYPICIPQSYKQDGLAISFGNIGEMASFGTDGTGLTAKVLQHAHITVASSAMCNDIINVIPERDQFCAGDPKGPSICRGDSGSGLMFKSNLWNEEIYSVHGIVSNTGELANDCGSMVLYTKVFSHASWIHEKLGSEYSKQSMNSRPEIQRTPTSVSVRYTRKEKESLRKLRPLVENILPENYMHRDEYLIRFLRAKDFNLKETKEMLKDAMEWRQANRVGKIPAEDFTEMKKKMPILFQGYDNEGRPVFVYWIGGWNLSEFFKLGGDDGHVRRYMIRSFEEIDERIRSIGATNITQAALIMDFNGVIPIHGCPGCLRNFAFGLKIHLSYYPDQVNWSFYINAPDTIDVLLDTILSVASTVETVRPISATTRVFGTNKTEWSLELLKVIPADQLFVAYSGTKTIRRGTKKIELAL